MQPQTDVFAARSQRGAVLLAFLLVLMVGAATMLVSRLNEHAQDYVRDSRTEQALNEAREALLAYAVNFPELHGEVHPRGPGFLPCPDHGPEDIPSPAPTDYQESLNDGLSEADCAESAGSTLGRLPVATLGLGDLRDSSGERLWYAVSQSYKSNQSKRYILNSDTRGTIAVDGADDIVAVIIAPGEPLASQSGRRGPTERDALLARTLYSVADQYLESDNATGADASYTAAGAGDFNDSVAVITRAELMQRVEKRVVSEVRAALAAYYAENGAYPEASPFRDPASGARWLRGFHDAQTASAVSLQDTTVDFSAWGVSAGDRVWNVTDGSSGRVTNVTATTLTVAELAFGADNLFQENDEYLVQVRALPGSFTGTAGPGSGGLVLEDGAVRDLEQLDIAGGDIVENLTDGSRGIVSEVDGSVLTVTALYGGTNNAFASGDSYRVRSNAGRATGNSAGLTLEDDTVDFTAMDVRAGDTVHNLTTGAVGSVVSVAAHELTVDALSWGSSAVFSENDYYTVSRFTPGSAEQEGLLAVHEPGQVSTPGFTIEWSITTGNGNTQVTDSLASDSTYRSGLHNWTQSSASNSGAVTVAGVDSRCTWVAPHVSDCRGSRADSTFLTGTVSATSSTWMEDSGRNFSTAGAKRGDLLINTADLTTGIVRQVSSSTRLTVSDIYGMTQFNKAAGQPYRLSVATDVMSGRARSPTAEGVYRLYDSFGSLALAEPGDVIENTNFSSIGVITAVGANGFGQYVDFTPLQNGTYTDFVVGESYQVHFNYVSRREYEFDVRFSGTAVGVAAAGSRTRTLCVGYGTDCNAASADTTMVGDGVTSVVTIRDYDEDDVVVGEASIRVPATGTPASSLKISALDFLLDDYATDLPPWFVKNRWHRSIYAGVSSGYLPSGAGSCVPGTDCLQLDLQRYSGTESQADRHALVIAVGAALNDTQRELRIANSLAGYLEEANAVQGETPAPLFEQRIPGAAFNDQVSTVCPDASNASCP